MGRLTLVGLALGFTLCACSGDDEGKKPSGAGAGAAGSMMAGSGGAGSGGAPAANSGTQQEAQLCKTTKDCASGLSCLGFGRIEDDMGRAANISVCARHCTDNTMCKSGEECRTESGNPADAACVSADIEILKQCNVVHSCSGELQCVLTNLDPSAGDLTGTCVQACMLPSGTCPSDLTCFDTLKNGKTGICSKTVERGEACDDIGLECKTGDLCISDGSSALCYQDCTMSGMCDDSSKSCIPLQGDDGKICDKL